MIYILDDSPVMLEATQRALEGLGPLVATSQWSELSNRLLRAPAGDLLVCDLNMPGMSGAEFCQIIRRYNAAVRIVVFTDAPADAPREIVDAVVSKHEDGFPGLRLVVSELLTGNAKAEDPPALHALEGLIVELGELRAATPAARARVEKLRERLREMVKAEALPFSTLFWLAAAEARLGEEAWGDVSLDAALREVRAFLARALAAPAEPEHRPPARGETRVVREPLDLSESEPISVLNDDLCRQLVAEALGYVATGRRSLERLTTAGGDRGALARLVRSFHTIKSHAGLLGLTQARELAALAEGAMTRSRRRVARLTPREAELCAQACGVLDGLLHDLAGGISRKASPPALQATLDGLRRLQQRTAASSG